MRIVYFGTPPFSADVLAHLIKCGVEVVAVVTRTDKPKGRSSQLIPSAVKEWALANIPNTPLLQPERVSALEVAPELLAFDADLFVVVAYGEILKEHVLKMPKLACINLHASLLPKYRGAAPIQRAMMQGEQWTGVTIQHMAKKMDAGNILGTVTIPIGANESAPSLSSRLARLGAPLLFDIIEAFSHGALPEVVQEESQVTFAPKIESGECRVVWEKSAKEIHNLIRAVCPSPGAWTMTRVGESERRVKLLSSKFIPSEVDAKPGTLLSFDEKGVVVACGEGLLLIETLQLEGKRAMSAVELLRGLSLSNFF